MTRYSHRQTGATIWWTLLGAGVFITALTVLLSGAVPEEDRFALRWIPATVGVVLLLCAWLFGSLTVTVDDERIVAAFGPGWPRKIVPLAKVRGVREVRNSWLYGWGIRITPHGWLYNVSGLDAVELDLSSGSRLRIGTDEPARLREAIQAALD